MEIISKSCELIQDFMKFKNKEYIDDMYFDEKTVVILGNFDGVHLGHLKIIYEAIKKAKKLNLKTILYTFREYPSKKDSLITSLSEKLIILDKIGVDYVYIDDFENIKDLSPDQFVEKILIDKLNSGEIYCGFNYTFGKNKAGDINRLYKVCENRVNINVIDPVIINLKTNENKVVKLNELKTYLDNDWNVISSTFIKSLLEKGNIDNVIKCLGHDYIIMGEVMHGKKLARTLGFPTANLNPSSRTYPIFGVYGARVNIQDYDEEFTGIINIGRNPTVENEGIHIETHILDFSDDIYGKIMLVRLLENIRLERKMNSLDELKEQISKDKIMWRNRINEKHKYECKNTGL